MKPHSTSKPSTTDTRLFTLAAMLTLLLAFGLRVWRLDAQSLWHDEGLSWWFARKPLWEMFTDVATTEHPPLYFLLLGMWMRVAGESEFALRFTSVVPGVLTVAGLIALGRRWRLRWEGMAAAFLLALNPTHIWYSQEVRSYAWMTALGLWLTYWAWRWHRTNRRRDGLVYGVSGGLALYVHIFLVFLLAAHALVIALPRWFREPRVRGRLRSVWPFFLMAAFFVPWVLPTLGQLRTNRTYWYWGYLDVPVVLRQTALAFAFYEMPEKMPVTFLRHTAYTMWALALLGSARVWRRKGGSLLVFSVWVPLAATLGLAYMVPKYAPRYVLYTLPVWLLLVAAVFVGALAWARQHRRRVFLALAGGAILAGLAVYTIGVAQALRLAWQPPIARPDFRRTVVFVREYALPEDAVILVGGHMEPVVRYYLRRQDVQVYPMPPRLLVDLSDPLTWWDVAPALERISQRHARAWLILWQEDLADPQRLVYSLLQTHTCRLDTPPDLRDVGLALFHFTGTLDLPPDPTPQFPVGIRFRNGLVLLGYDAARVLPPGTPLETCYRVRSEGNRLQVAPGETFYVVLYFQPTATLHEGLTGFVHLVTPDGSNAVGLMDRYLGGLAYPTTRWHVGEVVRQEFPVPVPADLPPGEYALEIGIYRPATLQRIDPLPATVPGARTDGSRILVGPVFVVP